MMKTYRLREVKVENVSVVLGIKDRKRMRDVNFRKRGTAHAREKL